jgi:L-threonylcarbamoyladenylate synthase
MASANSARYGKDGLAMRVLQVDPHRPDPSAIEEAAQVLERGGLVAFPTETVYGLGARAFDERAVLRVFNVKGRPQHHPLILHVTTENQARALAIGWPDAASRLARAFWPGPLTVVVQRGDRVPAAVAGGGSSVAIRAPRHAVAHALIAALGEPVAAPSANRFRELSPTIAAHVLKQLHEGVDLLLDGGPCDAGIESTVVDVRGARPRVLRPGAVSFSMLREVVGELEAPAALLASGQPPPSPGLDARHYAPRSRLLLAESEGAARRAAVALSAHGATVGLVVLEADAHAQDGRARILERALSWDPELYARQLFATLHDLDDRGVEAIVVQRVPSDEAWSAIADRLTRAAAPMP